MDLNICEGKLLMKIIKVNMKMVWHGCIQDGGQGVSLVGSVSVLLCVVVILVVPAAAVSRCPGVPVSQSPGVPVSRS